MLGGATAPFMLEDDDDKHRSGDFDDSVDAVNFMSNVSIVLLFIFELLKLFVPLSITDVVDVVKPPILSSVDCGSCVNCCCCCAFVVVDDALTQSANVAAITVVVDVGVIANEDDVDGDDILSSVTADG